MKRVVNGIKEGVSVFVLIVIIAIIINYMDLNTRENNIWNYLGKFEIIKIFDDNALNGLIVLGILISLGVFVLALFSPETDNK
ncbi:hypothetical protein RM650_03025 [Staphylococcus epidermidis]|uniref:hypothetical protein n=1 Tax=Staphylococcus epidermidis TaxID=1282 RepID=UPI001888E560|nr:hypothetical protein [Staphylococcus epidermidis]MBF2336086.1 hypothetical protein [Staphylococcus epidermidis]MCG1913719.1 hypothetical protein [Staphylococcus epidermidis]MCG2292528.1 hypothetical protein [Staphylococcus epidermidis]MDT0741918.1 hypothetical protein [Staphylococcus epidermidis]